jgi:fructokinase
MVRRVDDALAIGVDLGGTKIESVAMRRDSGEVLVRERVPTLAAEGYDAILARTASLVRRVAASAGAKLDRAPIGVGMPGGVTRREGLVKNSNTTCLNGRPFRADLERALGRVVAFDNDANCFALAETRLGAAKAHVGGVVFGVILGTGVGGGIVVRGEVWSGAQGIAGEWGHHVVVTGGRACYCGNTGCLERYASGPAVEGSYHARTGRALSLADIAARRDADDDARAAVEELVDAFGRGLANVIDVLDPSAVVLGGGVSQLALLYDEGTARVARYVFNDELVTPILKHSLGDSAGVLGAALIARSPLADDG